MSAELNPTVDRLTGLGLDVFVRRGSAYVLLKGPLSWRQSRREARGLGGDLVTISSQKENNFITRTFKPLAADPCGLWIGLNSYTKPGGFTWSNGERAPYRNWVPAGIPGYKKGMPSDDPNRKFVHIYFNSNATGYWKNSDNTYHDVVLGGGIAEFPL